MKLQFASLLLLLEVDQMIRYWAIELPILDSDVILIDQMCPYPESSYVYILYCHINRLSFDVCSTCSSCAKSKAKEYVPHYSYFSDYGNATAQ